MKNLLFSIFIGCSLLLVLNCKKNHVKVRGSPSPTDSTYSPTKRTGYVAAYGQVFKVQNSSLYEKLLEACKRCGTKRLIENSDGSTTYQDHDFLWGTQKGDPKRCDSWNAEGYIQIVFAEKKLPTKATVSIWPKYTGGITGFLCFDGLNREWCKESIFEVTATANPINENKGFQILMTPTHGLGGTHFLSIYSNYSNHVKQSELDITVTYGRQQDSQNIIFEKLPKLNKKAVGKASVTCEHYTN